MVLKQQPVHNPDSLVTDPLSEHSDDTLVRLACTGNAKAFERLIRRYESPVYNYLYRMLNQDAHRAEEAAQETFIQAYIKLNTFQLGRPFRPWLLGIATNQAKSLWRKQQQQHQRENLSESDDYDPLVDIADPTAHQLDDRLMQQTILQTIETMDDRYKSVLLLRFQEDLSYQDIAETLNIQLNTVRTWLRRGKQWLQKAIDIEALTHDTV